MSLEFILDPSDPQSSRDLATRRTRCLANLDSLLSRYTLFGQQLADHMADQGWSPVPELHQEAIDRLNSRRTELNWFALAEWARAKSLGVGDAAEEAIKTAVDDDAATAGVERIR